MAIVLTGPFDPAAAREYDLVPVALAPELTMFHVNQYFAAYWQARRAMRDELEVPSDYPTIFPCEGVVRAIVVALTKSTAPTYALIMTDYFGGAGDQWACVFTGTVRWPAVRRINDALRALGVKARDDLDEFDTVGLSAHRSTPEYLERYMELCDELGV
jgi:hypothetical protein